MNYKEIIVKTLINRITFKDSLFLGDFTIDPYQNCEFGCKYCDSSFEDMIYIKKNTENLLKNEIKKIQNGTIIIGSVHDPYQDIEKEYKFTRMILKYIKKYNLQCHILTKSDLIIRDLDILSSLNNPIVTISISSLNKLIIKIFEKRVISPYTRLKLIKKLNDEGIKTGLAVIPCLPFIIENEIDKIFKNAYKYNSNYIVHKYLELKGNQKTVFFDILKKYLPNLKAKYEELYKNSYMPIDTYIKNIDQLFDYYCKKFKLQFQITI